MPEKEQVFVDLEHFIYAVIGLLEDTIEPMFHCTKCDSILEEISKEEGCSREDAALSWMEDNYDSLLASIFAIRVFMEVLEP